MSNKPNWATSRSCQSRVRCSSGQDNRTLNSKMTIGQILYGTPPLDASESIITIAANHKETFSIMHIDVSRSYFHAKAQRRRWQNWYGEKEHEAIGSVIGKSVSKSWSFQHGLSSKNLFHQGRHTVMTSFSQDRQNDRQKFKTR